MNYIDHNQWPVCEDTGNQTCEESTEVGFCHDITNYTKVASDQNSTDYTMVASNHNSTKYTNVTFYHDSTDVASYENIGCNNIAAMKT